MFQNEFKIYFAETKDIKRSNSMKCFDDNKDY